MGWSADHGGRPIAHYDEDITTLDTPKPASSPSYSRRQLGLRIRFEFSRQACSNGEISLVQRLNKVFLDVFEA